MIKVLPLVLLCFVGMPYSGSEQRHPVRLIVKVTGVRSALGKVRLASWRSSDGFLDDGRVFRAGVYNITNGEAEAVFDNVPVGPFAAIAFHDENDNGKMDKNAFGLPKEGYGFSNGAKIRFGPPTFEKALINVHDDAQVIIIHLDY